MRVRTRYSNHLELIPQAVIEYGRFGTLLSSRVSVNPFDGAEDPVSALRFYDGDHLIVEYASLRSTVFFPLLCTAS